MVYKQEYMDRGKNYDPSGEENGCDRSDVAEVRQLAERLNNGLKPGDIGYYKSKNIACSGAETKDITRERFKGQRLQLTDLGEFARHNHVKMIVISIGGNDMGFGPVAKRCGVAYLLLGRTSTCVKGKANELQTRLTQTQANVKDTLLKIKEKMEEVADYDDYRIVLQSYPQMLPRVNNIRYPASGLTPRARLMFGGCPFSDSDVKEVRKWVVNLSDAMREAAHEASENGVNVDFLELHQAFNGHEVCANKSGKVDIVQATSGNRAANSKSASMEWMRYATVGSEDGTVPGQGQGQESLHPNAFGQRALGKCLQLLFSKASGQYTCKNTPEKGYNAMTVRRLKSTTK